MIGGHKAEAARANLYNTEHGLRAHSRGQAHEGDARLVDALLLRWERGWCEYMSLRWGGSNVAYREVVGGVASCKEQKER